MINEKAKANKEIFDRNGITGSFENKVKVEDDIVSMSRPYTEKELKLIEAFEKSKNEKTKNE